MSGRGSVSAQLHAGVRDVLYKRGGHGIGDVCDLGSGAVVGMYVDPSSCVFLSRITVVGMGTSVCRRHWSGRVRGGASPDVLLRMAR
jgi:hypothetical protein